MKRIIVGVLVFIVTAGLCVFAGSRLRLTTTAPALAQDSSTPDTTIIQSQVSSGSDDAEERENGTVSLDSTDLELVTDRKAQTVGMVFRDLEIPKDVIIVNAYIQFQADEVSINPTKLLIRGEATDSAQTFEPSQNNITTRQLTLTYVNWSPPAWAEVAAAGAEQRTPDLSAIIQEIIDRPGWTPGNAIALIVSGTGNRTAEAYNGRSAAAPILYIEFQARPPTSNTIQSRINSETDDAEEIAGGVMALDSTALELVTDGSPQTIGMVFRTLEIPQNAVILNAYIQFQAGEATNEPTNLLLRGEATDNAETFAPTPNNITSRPLTNASATWSPPAWTKLGAAGADQRTPNLGPIIQEIIDRPGWTSGNAIAFIISGTGTRIAAAYEGDAAGAPTLYIEYEPGSQTSFGESTNNSDNDTDGNNPVITAPTVEVKPTVEQELVIEHTVQPGETLSHIALKYYGSAVKEKYMVIYEANKDVIGDNPNKIKTGQVLTIPDL